MTATMISQPKTREMQPETAMVRISQIKFDEAIYPRPLHGHDPVKVQEYADCLEEIEAAGHLLALSTDFKLLDGKHRWLAYRKRYDGEDREIRALIYPVTTPDDQLELSCKLNNSHGVPLPEDEKEADAKRLYAYGKSYDQIAAALSRGKAKVSAWLARTVKENKDRRDQMIVEMWLANEPQEAIANKAECTQQTIANVVDGFTKSVLENQNGKLAALANYADETFERPIYNILKQQEKTPGSSHFGNSEPRILDNLLYLYTQPFDVVVDPFAGGGSTIDICKKRLRRYWVSDRKPIVEREQEIRKHDLTDGLPPLHRWQDVKLVYLDPPYWCQAGGEYSDDPSDLANMPLDRFTSTLAGIINGFAKKLSPGAVIALLMQPTQ